MLEATERLRSRGAGAGDIDGVRKLPKEMGRESRGGVGATDGMGIEVGI